MLFQTCMPFFLLRNIREDFFVVEMLETKQYWWALTYNVKHYKTFSTKSFDSVAKKKLSQQVWIYMRVNKLRHN